MTPFRTTRCPSARAPGPPGQDTGGRVPGPFTVRPAGERIAERLVTAIALGEFMPGQRLPPERDLAAQLEVSCSAVREARQRLQAAGYLTTRRGRGGGTFVRGCQGPEADDMIRRTLEPDWEEFSELLDFRLLVERMVARTAAERRDEGDIAAIREAVDAYERAPDRETARVADHALHTAVAQAARNTWLMELSARLRREVSLGFDAEPYSPSARRRALQQHPDLARAIIAGDATAAASVAGQHYSLTDGMLRELHARTGLRSGAQPDPGCPVDDAAGGHAQRARGIAGARGGTG